MKTKTDLSHQETQAAFFKLLTHPVRIAILQILAQEEACVCHLEAVLGYRQAYLSQQLAVLRESGLIVDRRDGWNVFYQLKDRKVLDVLTAAEVFLPSDVEKIDLSPIQCPCPNCSVKIEAAEEPCCQPKNP